MFCVDELFWHSMSLRVESTKMMSPHNIYLHTKPITCLLYTLRIGYRSYITIIKELSWNERNEWTTKFLNNWIYDLCPTYSFLLLFHDCTFRNGLIDHFTDLLNRYYKYWQNMWLSWPKILISVQTDWLWSTVGGGVNYKTINIFHVNISIVFQ